MLDEDVFPTAPRKPLIEDQTIDSWVRTMFGANRIDEAEGVRLIVKVDGHAIGDGPMGALAEHDEDVRAAIRELTQSLEMYGVAHVPGDTLVRAPAATTIRAALCAIVDPNARRRTLGAALATFGRRVMKPLEGLLAAGDNPPAVRLEQFRTRARDMVSELAIAHETRAIVQGDLDKWLSDAYLAMLAEYEESTLRPQLSELAQRVLGVLATVFHRALDRFAANAEHVAERIARQVPASLPLRELPSMLKMAFIGSVADFLQVETEAELRGALSTLSKQYAHAVPGDRPLAFDESWYVDLARECWQMIEVYG